MDFGKVIPYVHKSPYVAYCSLRAFLNVKGAIKSTP